MQPVSPNPTRGLFVVAFTLPAAGPTSLEIVDLFGRRVAYRSASLEAGVNTWRMDAGRPLTAGIYLIRLLQGREHAVAKACVLR